jgi:hypothetical protein
MMNLEILQETAVLAPPTITFQYMALQELIGLCT